MVGRDRRRVVDARAVGERLNARRRLAADHRTARAAAEIVEIYSRLPGERVAERRLTAVNQFLTSQRDHRRCGLVGAEAEDIGRDDDLGIGGAAGLHEAGVGPCSGFDRRHRFARKGDVRNDRTGGELETSQKPLSYLDAGRI